MKHWILLITKGAPPFEGLYDTREALERAGKGGIINTWTIIKDWWNA